LPVLRLGPCNVQVQTVFRGLGDVAQSERWVEYAQWLRASRPGFSRIDSSAWSILIGNRRLEPVFAAGVLSIWNTQEDFDIVASNAYNVDRVLCVAELNTGRGGDSGDEAG
jgi:hypothetical protein